MPTRERRRLYRARAARLAATLSALPALCIGVPGAALGQGSYPVKPVRFVVPYPPGGSADLFGRLIGQKLSESLGHVVVIDDALNCSAWHNVNLRGRARTDPARQ